MPIHLEGKILSRFFQIIIQNKVNTFADLCLLLKTAEHKRKTGQADIADNDIVSGLIQTDTHNGTHADGTAECTAAVNLDTFIYALDTITESSVILLHGIQSDITENNRFGIRKRDKNTG